MMVGLREQASRAHEVSEHFSLLSISLKLAIHFKQMAHVIGLSLTIFEATSWIGFRDFVFARVPGDGVALLLL